MFDSLIFQWHKIYRELVGHALSLSRCARWTAPASHACCTQRHVAVRSSTCLWYFQAVGQQLGEAQTRQRTSSPPFLSTRPPMLSGYEALPGRDDCTTHYPLLSRSTHFAIHALDTRSDPAVDQETLWSSTFRLDSRTLFGSLGLHSAKIGAPGLRTRSSLRTSLAQTQVPGDSRPGQKRKGNDILGRRNRNAFGSSIGDLFRSTGPNAGHSGHRQEISMQHDFGDYQPRPLGFHGFQRKIHNTGISRFPQTPAQATSAQGFSDSRSPSCSYCEGRVAAGQKQSAASSLLLARLQSTVESRRAAQPGCESQRRWAPASTNATAIDKERTTVSLEYSASEKESPKLLSRASRSLRCLTCQTFLLPVICGQRPGEHQRHP